MSPDWESWPGNGNFIQFSLEALAPRPVGLSVTRSVVWYSGRASLISLVIDILVVRSTSGGRGPGIHGAGFICCLSE